MLTAKKGDNLTVKCIKKNVIGSTLNIHGWKEEDYATGVSTEVGDASFLEESAVP